MKVLGPAGGHEAFDAAIAAGADEIYMGLTGYGARRYAENFTVDGFVEALNKAHQMGVELSLTLNTLMSESEIETVLPDLDRLVSADLDSVIVQDWGVLRFLRRRYPNLSIHGSTQMGLGSSREIQFAAKSGMTRVVLPRELSLDEIAAIRSAVPEIELEVFSSGALCLGCSGKCYLSSYVGGRSGNRGSCAQPCRQSYTIESNHGSSDLNEKYFLSLRDQLFSRKDIADLAAIGIDVIKIEGRMKSPAYVFEAVSRYRSIVDSLCSSDEIQEEDALQPIERLFNRGYCSGFLREHDPDILNPLYGSHYGFPIGKVNNGMIYLSTPLVNGDGIAYLDQNFKKLSGTNVSRIRLQPKLYGENVKVVPRAEAGTVVTLDPPIPPHTQYIYKTLDFSQHKETSHHLKTARRRRPIILLLTAKVGRPLQLVLKLADPIYKDESVLVESQQLLEKSHNQHIDVAILNEAVDRFGASPFRLQSAEFDFDSDTFIPKSLLSRLRQEAIRQLETRCSASNKKAFEDCNGNSIIPSEHVEMVFPLCEQAALPLRYAAAVRTVAQGITVLSAGINHIYRIPAPIRYEDESAAAMMENEFLNTEFDANTPFKFQPIAGNITEAIFYEERGISFTADTSFNVTNYESGLFLLEKFTHLKTLYLSNELSRDTVLQLGNRLIPHLSLRGGRVGHTVYGHPIAMYTRKTLFPRKKTVLKSQGRKFLILRNKDLFAEKSSSASVTGSSIFYFPPLNILRQTKNFPDGWELRFDFSIESPSEMKEVAEIWKSNSSSQGVGFGFDHPIF